MYSQQDFNEFIAKMKTMSDSYDNLEKQGYYLNCIDSLDIKMKQIPTKELQTLIFREKGRLFFSAGKLDSAEVYYKRAIENFEIFKYSQFEMEKTYFSLGNIFKSRNNNEEAMKSYLRSLNYFKYKDEKLLPTILNNIGLTLTTAGNHEEALKYFDESIQISKKFSNNKAISNSYLNIAMVYYNMIPPNFAKSVEFARKALIFNKLANDSKANEVIKLNLSAFLIKIDSFHEAKNLLLELERKFKKTGTKDNKLYVNLFNAYTGLNVADSSIFYFNLIDVNKIKKNDSHYFNTIKKAIADGDVNLHYFFEIKRLQNKMDSINNSLVFGNAVELEKKYKLSIKQKLIDSLEIIRIRDGYSLQKLNNQKLQQVIKMEAMQKDQNSIVLNNFILTKSRDSVRNEKLLITSKNAELAFNNKLQSNSINNLRKLILFGGISFFIISCLSFFLYRQRQKQKTLTTQVTSQRDQIQLLNRELNHRVKNNLAFMTSLLEMQGRRSDNIETKQLLQESETRLKTLALVHANLFKNEADTDINLKSYLTEIIQNLNQLFELPDKSLEINSTLIDHNIDAEDAMRLGLVVNELITNSVKHAFHEVANPEIKITTSLNTDGKLVLDYKDNGPGASFTQNDSVQNSASLGTKLIELLKRQLEGRVVVVC